ncbi:AAA-domain-containing protein [Bimuria novae-zelandiae CBS 107.79]|uniref:AAA-domain-containing protein n=1 Tax=Bimuria novae-zelandiae CBS 107.79 TaxID=1447943 RepID=A0A6A5UMS4_9PLEO|nr:AAA-domain-containing protein [Bimuria novae-zelandiae CBS 107.79]
MSSRSKRKLEHFDPNASDPDDHDWDATERPSPQRRRKRHTSGAPRKKSSKRQRRGYSGSDVDDDDEIVSDNSFTDRSSSEEVEINPTTGRSVRRATKKQIKYEESEEDEIQDTPSESDSPAPRGRNKAQQSIEHPSLIVKLPIGLQAAQQLEAKMAPGRNLRNRQGSKSLANINTRSETPNLTGTRRNTRRSQPCDEPMVALSDSGRHVVREGTSTPEPIPTRATRGAKAPRASAIMEASQEDSMVQRDDSVGPLDNLLTENTEPQVQGSPEHEAQAANEDAEGEEDEEMQEGVVQDSQHDPLAADDEEDDEDGPVTRGGARSLRSAGKRKRGVDESSDFEPAPEEEKEDEEMSDADQGKGHRSTSEDSGSGSGRRSARIRAKTRNRSRRHSDSSDQESVLDADELAEEAQELAPSKRRRLNRNLPDSDLAYDKPARRNRARNQVDYRIVRPELNAAFDDETLTPAAEKSRSRGGASKYRSLFSNQGPFGGGLEAGAGLADDSDSSDDEVQKMPKTYGGTVGMTPTTATAPGFGFPQTHNADPQQATGAGGGPANLGKVKDKKALADADPLGVDPNVTFDAVGGLEDHINKLKEMVQLPLLYPEIFLEKGTTPPRGVLFHGPPGTGKTLLARALSSTLSNSGQKVSFYMRKGADALSKWVGEAERQLRLLFEEARKNQPSIIFFDEIDGLAPVRSSKQEQIHASIVATLLALMDGMDGRGQVIVIGATNRPDSVDPALRRPGRFDREFYFPLPDAAGRRSIIDIHTKGWEPPLKPEMKDQLAELTKGYGGADLRALCTEAALNAVQGTYPQIYTSERKLLIDPKNIKVLAKDFMISVNKIVPSSQRTATSKAAPLPKGIEPLLRKPLAELQQRIDKLIPRRKKLSALEEAQYDDRDEANGFEKEMIMRSFSNNRLFRPRLLITGLEGMGQRYLSAALLSKVEGLHVQSFDLPTLYEDSTRPPEQAIIQLFNEVKRHKPSVIYIPAVNVWCESIPDAAYRMFKMLLRDIGGNEPILLLGVMEQEKENERPDPTMMKDLFPYSQRNIFTLNRPDQDGRREFFEEVARYIRMSPADFPDPDNRKKRVLPELLPAPIVAPVVDPRELAAREKKQRKADHLTLQKLKLSIQPVMDQLKKGYRKFAKPIIEEHNYEYLLVENQPQSISTDLPPEQQQQQEQTRYWTLATDDKGVDVLQHIPSGNKYYNLDLVNIEKRLSNGYYKRPRDFLWDIKTLAKDARTLGDAERTLKGNEMVTNVEVDIEHIIQTNPALAAECEAVYVRELERERKAKEKQERERAAGQEPTTIVAPVPPQHSTTTTEGSGPIVLGEAIPTSTAVPPVTPLRPFPPGPLTNGTSEGQNGSTVPSRTDEDAHMTDSQDLDANTQHHEFQTPSRVGTQTQKSQMSARTFIAPNSNPHEYHNSASTTTSGKKTSDRSSGTRFSTQHNTQSTNGTGPVGAPDFSEMTPGPGGSQLPDTQGLSSSYKSNPTLRKSRAKQPSPPEFPDDHSSQHHPSQSQSSQNRDMPAPAVPRGPAALTAILNDPTEEQHPALLLDEGQLKSLHKELVTRSSGCSLEQLEQINAALMETVWEDRREWNRNKTMHRITEAFNAIITDINETQKLQRQSQEEHEDFFREVGGGGGGSARPSAGGTSAWYTGLTQQGTQEGMQWGSAGRGPAGPSQQSQFS